MSSLQISEKWNYSMVQSNYFTVLSSDCLEVASMFGSYAHIQVGTFIGYTNTTIIGNINSVTASIRWSSP
jgi:hypothetical protein